ncbi:MAG: hypothetical protein L0H84_23950 [Pseudonocardia sp.]|nr:hypothetical protein [Pseudonocardia sp.]
MHGIASMLVAWRTEPPQRRLTRTTIVAVRTDDDWRIRSLNNSRVRPIGVPGPDAVPSRMARALVRAAAALGIGNARAALT